MATYAPRLPATSTTREAYKEPPLSSQHSYSPKKEWVPTGPSSYMSTNQQFHVAFANHVPVKSMKPAYVPPSGPAYKFNVITATTQQRSFAPPPLASQKSYAPAREFVPSGPSSYMSTNRAEYQPLFKLPEKSAKPAYVAPSYQVHASALTTQRQAFAPPPLAPQKSYAPSRVFVPNPAPLGTSTNRAEYVPYFK